MKYSIAALAAAGLFSSGAFAQSSGLTIYGRVDLSVGKSIGSDTKYLADGSSSRLGIRGSEDLGNGFKAFFNIEHRFEADSGVVGNGIAGRSSPGPRFWYGRSVVGFDTPYGQLALGREYTPAFQMVRVKGTPFGYDFVTSVNAVTSVLGLSIGATRNDSAITYKGTFSDFTISGQVAEATDTLSTFQVKPASVAVAYNPGPLYIGVSYDRPGLKAAKTANVVNTFVSYDFGVAELSAAYIKGTTQTGEGRKGWMLAASAPLGNGELRAAYGVRKMKDGDVTDTQMVALGYYYNLSKRTAVYADYVRNSKFATEKAGYDMGLKVTF
jgi:predicted porin